MVNERIGVVPMFVCLTVVLIVWFPSASSELAWKEDGWLTTSLADERLALGDEFGCYGIPGLSWELDPGAIANQCDQYISQRTVANRWGMTPISIHTPANLVMTDHEKIASQGFFVHGDNTGLETTAWHSAQDEPTDRWDWYNFGRRGGSLEKGIASLEMVKNEIERGGVVNMYWIGRVNDATVRHDNDVLDYLERQTNIWYTTWGEVWSLWNAQRCYEFIRSITPTQTGALLSFEVNQDDACEANEPRAWNVPETWVFELTNATVKNVMKGSLGLPSIEGVQQSIEGWRLENESTMYLSLTRGTSVTIELEGENLSYDILGQTQFWNNLTTAFTLAGHGTSDLFLWSKRFVEHETIRFTWLLTPRDVLEDSTLLPVAVVLIAGLTVLGMFALIKKEQLNASLQVDFHGIDSKNAMTSQNHRRLDESE